MLRNLYLSCVFILVCIKFSNQYLQFFCHFHFVFNVLKSIQCIFPGWSWHQNNCLEWYNCFQQISLHPLKQISELMEYLLQLSETYSIPSISLGFYDVMIPTVMNVWVFHVSYMRGWIHWRDNSISKSVTLYWWNYPFKESIPWMPEPLLEVLADLKSYHIKNYDSSTFFTKIMSKDRSGHIFKRMHNSRKMSTKYKAFFLKCPVQDDLK